VLLYALYSGQLFFFAVALFIAGVIAGKRVGEFLALLAVPLAVLSGPPMPFPLAVLLLAISIAYFVKPRALRTIAILAGLIAVAVELPYHIRRSHVPLPSHIVVIGDSLASGGFGEKMPWPAVLEQRLKIPVTNLALASSDVTMAVERQVPAAQGATRGCVVIEIGGNDMIDGLDLGRFTNGLDRILAGSGGRSLVMLELPLLPGRWSYGAVQRKLAKKYRCALVPKRVLAGVLLGDGNTFDGIHLTQRGHDALAAELGRWLGWSRGR
jgi:acyl-CoA thioesterase I